MGGRQVEQARTGGCGRKRARGRDEDSTTARSYSTMVLATAERPSLRERSMMYVQCSELALAYEVLNSFSYHDPGSYNACAYPEGTLLARQRREAPPPSLLLVGFAGARAIVEPLSQARDLITQTIAPIKQQRAKVGLLRGIGDVHSGVLT